MLLHPRDSLFKGASFAPLCLPRCSSDPRSALVTHLSARYLLSPFVSQEGARNVRRSNLPRNVRNTRPREISSEVEQWRSEASLWFSSSIHRWSCHLFFVSPHNEPGSLMLYVLHPRLTPLPPFRAQAAHLKALGTITVHRAQCPSYCIERCL